MIQRNKKRSNIMRYLFAIIVALFLTGALAAQVHAKVNVNISNQPIWGPTGFDHVDNYYLPDIETYYNVPTHRYYYNEGGRWKNSASLPSKNSNYDLYNSHKVVVNENQPWKNHATNQTKYATYKGCLLYTSPSPRDRTRYRMPSSA